MRREHNNQWQSPAGQKGKLPNEMFFVRKIEFNPKLTTGMELRSEEDEFIKNQAKSLNLNEGKTIEMNMIMSSSLSIFISDLCSLIIDMTF